MFQTIAHRLVRPSLFTCALAIFVTQAASAKSIDDCAAYRNWQLDATGLSYLRKRWPDIVRHVESLTGRRVQEPMLAIGDSGLRHSELKLFRGTLEVGPADDSYLAPDLVEHGHGLMVTSTAVGVDTGYLTDANVRFVSLTKKGADGKEFLDDSAAYAAALRACTDGYKVINFSFGGAEAFEKIKPDHRKQLEELQSLGCVIVKASGNGGSSSSKLSHPALLLVGSVSPFGGISIFSSRSELGFPGERLTLPTRFEKQLCPDRLGLVNGTSFAAPGSATVLAQMQALLAASSRFQALKGLKQLSLVRDLLREATTQENGELNSIRAIRASVTAIQKLESRPSASLDALFCRREDEDTLEGLLFHLQACTPNTENFDRLFEFAQRRSRSYLFFGALRKFGRNSAFARSTVEKWIHAAKSVSRTDDELNILFALQPHLQTAETDDLVNELLLKIMKSGSTRYTFEKGIAIPHEPNPYLDSNHRSKLIGEIIDHGLLRFDRLSQMLQRPEFSLSELINGLYESRNLPLDDARKILPVIKSSTDFSDYLRVGFGKSKIKAFEFYQRAIVEKPKTLKFTEEQFEERIASSLEAGRMTSEQKDELLTLWRETHSSIRKSARPE